MRSNEACLDVFLCGKGQIKGETSLRDKLRDKFKNENNVRILYPEDLFIDLFNKKRHYDMLSLEKFLASNCDVICIICEDSPGALVELGAFTNSSETFEKVMAMVPIKYKNNKSFIMLGPIKYLQQNNKESVLFYSSDMDDTYKKLSRKFKRRLLFRHRSHKKDIDTIIGQYYFILMIIYYFKVIEVEDLVRYLRYVIKERKIVINDFDLLYSASLKQLYKDKIIEKNSESSLDCYNLTDKGNTKFYKTFNTIKLFNKTKRGDAIRLSVLAQKYY